MTQKNSGVEGEYDNGRLQTLCSGRIRAWVYEGANRLGL